MTAGVHSVLYFLISISAEIEDCNRELQTVLDYSRENRMTTGHWGPRRAPLRSTISRQVPLTRAAIDTVGLVTPKLTQMFKFGFSMLMTDELRLSEDLI